MDAFMCYGPVVPDGYGACYNPHPDYILVCISSFSSCDDTASHFFAMTLESSLMQMKELCLTASATSSRPPAASAAAATTSAATGNQTRPATAVTAAAATGEAVANHVPQVCTSSSAIPSSPAASVTAAGRSAGGCGGDGASDLSALPVVSSEGSLV